MLKRILGATCLVGAVMFSGCANSTPAVRPQPTAASASGPAAPQRNPDYRASAPASSGAASPAHTLSISSGGDRVVARVGGREVTFGELLEPLIEAHGLEFLFQLLQLEAVQQAAEQKGIQVSAQDVADEREQTLSRLFQDVEEKTREQIEQAEAAGQAEKVKQLRADLERQREGLMEQFLQQQYVQTRNYMSRQEFDILLRTNAYLRKLAEARPEIRAEIPEQALKDDFAILYGEKAVVRHIQLSNLQEVNEAKRRLATQSFAEVASALSRNRQTAPVGGELPPFTQNSEEIPLAFREAAFRLKPGEVSDAIQTGDAYHLVKLERRVAPRAVTFESVKKNLQQQRRERMVQLVMNELRRQFTDDVRNQMRIEDPRLQQIYVERLEAQKAKLRERDDIRRQMERERGNGAATRPVEPSPAEPPPDAPADPLSSGAASPAPATRAAPAPAPGARAPEPARAAPDAPPAGTSGDPAAPAEDQ